MYTAHHQEHMYSTLYLENSKLKTLERRTSSSRITHWFGIKKRDWDWDCTFTLRYVTFLVQFSYSALLIIIVILDPLG